MKSIGHNVLAVAQLMDGNFLLNGKIIVRPDFSNPQHDWFKRCYFSLGMQYPKFHKMDALSKLAVLNAEILLKDFKTEDHDKSKTGLLLFNRNSSIDADVTHQYSIADLENPMPGPAVFVYTLPNIMLGEISIRHGITGENMCLIVPDFEASTAMDQCEMMFRAGMEHVLLGWVDSAAGMSKSWMALIAKDGNAPNYSQLSARFLNETDNIPEWKHS